MINDYQVGGKSFIADKKDLEKIFPPFQGEEGSVFGRTRAKYLNFKMEIIA